MDVWYATYGSNICKERFMCYIKGGSFRLGGRKLEGCKDKTEPKDGGPFMIPYPLYFARKSDSWGSQGVAFLALKKTSDKSERTYGRIWKITEDQFLEVWDQEGKGWYDKKVGLGRHDDNLPIYTFTSSSALDGNSPSKEYLETLRIGLDETWKLKEEDISKYIERAVRRSRHETHTH